MAENQEAPEAEAVEPAVETSPAAMAVALGRTSKRSKALDEDASTFLREQTELIRLQKEDLHEHREVQLERLKLGRWKDRVSLALQGMTVAVGLIVVLTVGVMAWRAHEDRGLVIDAFSVPPDLARDGLTGEVVAGRFLDKLRAIQAATPRSDRPAASFQDNWGSEIKVEIPETGRTFGEFEKLLRDKLGHVSRVSGEVLKTPEGIAVTARIGDAPPQTFKGADGDFDLLTQKAAETVYRSSQPYRYAEYLDQQGRLDEAFGVISDLAQNGPRSERGWAYAKWALMELNYRGDMAAAREHAAKGLGHGAGSDLQDRIAIVSTAIWSGREQLNLENSRLIYAQTHDRPADTSEFFFEDTKLLSRAWLEFTEADFRGAVATWFRTATEDPDSLYSDQDLSLAMAATAQALDHDLSAARRTAAAPSVGNETAHMWTIAQGAFPALPNYWIAAEAGDWPAALADARTVDAWLQANKTSRPIYGLMQGVWIWPLEAMARARSGDVAGGQALIERTPLDCYVCLRVRGQIAAAAQDWTGAERWLAEAIRQGPSLPFAYVDLAQVRLARGDADGAIDRLALAHDKAPRFADPLELWGEALLRKGDFGGAVARFAAADKAAPRWGRNHLLWGEALGRLGRRADAQAQYRAAAALDLSPADRAELARAQAQTST